jgi:hypothetical protein
MPNNQGSYTPVPVSLGNPTDCKVGRRAIHVTIDFSLGARFNLDLSQVQSQGGLDSVQTIYIDNSNSVAGTLTILMGLTLQSVKVPAGAQAYLPVLQVNPPVLQFTMSTGTPKIDIQLMNFFVPPCMWYTVGLPVNDLTLAAVIANGGVNVNAQSQTVTVPTDASGTITLGGTPQLLFAANAARKRFIISNPSTATEVLQFAYGNTGHYINLSPGTTWDEADFSVSGDAIYVNAATTSHAFVAYTW